MSSQENVLSSQIDEFLSFLETKKYSPLTIRNYTHYLTRLLNFLAQNKQESFENTDGHLIDHYKNYLSGLTISKKTLGYHLICLRTFLKWIKSKGGTVNIEEINIPKSEATKIEFLSGRDVERLLNLPDTKTIQGKRDRAILELFYATGLRVSELTSLDKTNLDNVKNELSIGLQENKKRIVFLSTRALNWLKVYLDARKDITKPLFVSHKGKPTRLTPRSVQRMIKKYTKMVGLSINITPKTLRHSFATDLLIAGADIRSVQEMLGHKNISTTQIYTHVTNRQLRDIHETFHGKGN